MRVDVPPGFSGAAGGRSAPTVTGSGVWVRWGLVSRVLVGGEGGEGGGRRKRERGGLRTDASCRRRVCHRLRDTEWERRGDKRRSRKTRVDSSFIYLLSDTEISECFR